MFAQLSAFLAAWTETAKALSALAAWKQSSDMQRLGQLEQETVLLRSENAQLKTQNAALVHAAGVPGSARL